MARLVWYKDEPGRSHPAIVNLITECTTPEQMVHELYKYDARVGQWMRYRHYYGRNSSHHKYYRYRSVVMQDDNLSAFLLRWS